MATEKDIGVAKPMPEDPTDQDTSDLHVYSDEDIEKALESGGELPPKPSTADESESEEATEDDPRLTPLGAEAEESEQPSEVGEPEPGINGETEGEPKTEESAEARQSRMESERRSAELELSRAHSARLAGKIGYLEKQLKDLRARTEREPESVSDEDQDRVGVLERTVDELRSRTRTDAVAQAVQEEAGKITLPEAEKLSSEDRKAILEKYAEDWTQALEETDVGVARKMVRAVLRLAAADARDIVYQREQEAARAKAGEQKARLRKAKLAESTTARTAGGPTATRPAPAKTVAEMTDKEVEALTDKLLAGGS